MHCVNGTNVIAGRRKAGEKREAVVRPVTAARLSSGEDGAKEEDRKMGDRRKYGRQNGKCGRKKREPHPKSC